MKTRFKPFVGKWSIVEMEAWDQEYVNMEVLGHFTFKKDGTGHSAIWYEAALKNSRNPSDCSIMPNPA